MTKRAGGLWPPSLDHMGKGKAQLTHGPHACAHVWGRGHTHKPNFLN